MIETHKKYLKKTNNPKLSLVFKLFSIGVARFMNGIRENIEKSVQDDDNKAVINELEELRKKVGELEIIIKIIIVLMILATIWALYSY